MINKSTFNSSPQAKSKDYLVSSWSQILLLLAMLATGLAGTLLPLPAENKIWLLGGMVGAIVASIFYYRLTKLHKHDELEVLIDLIFVIAILIVIFAAKQFSPWFFFWFYILAITDAIIYSYRHIILVLLLITAGLAAYLLLSADQLPLGSEVAISLNIVGLWTISHFMWFYAQDNQNLAIKGQKALNQMDQMRKLELQQSEFIHLASHQLKSPLTIIRFLITDLLNKKKLAKDFRQKLNQSLHQSEVVLQFLDDIMRIIRTESQHILIKREPVDLESLIKEVCAELNETIQEKKIQLTKQIGGVIPILNTDRVYLKIALTNIIDNALKYSPPGSKIDILVVCPRTQEIEITVLDRGIGIANADQIRLFEKFFRGQNAQALVPNGTGLGLYLVKMVLKKLDAKITFQSQIHKGSKFTITLLVK